ncbi:hypothetical protein KP509_29G080200 [Ceratopteris richardii]|uniref:Secreted protein n=1 Tax=Ceratopteris richardii TaxID=49495 RepID=A0A8T2R8C7_CERRI|nr:hypothetical protein KP509_29G080200 [Ceratopteris richardii]
MCSPTNVLLMCLAGLHSVGCLPFAHRVYSHCIWTLLPLSSQKSHREEADGGDAFLAGLFPTQQ